MILSVVDQLINDFHVDELHQLLLAFHVNQLDSALWRELQILRCDLYQKSGQHDNALAACRAALKVTAELRQQARLYRRMGKLYEKRNPRHALGYYDQAAERFAPDDGEYPILLKDRGWVYIIRQEWQNAENDLQLALTLSAGQPTAVRADIYDALASLYGRQRQYPIAIAHAQQALGLREAMGDLLGVAKSFGNLGGLYSDTGDYVLAIDAYMDAMATYEKLGNRELMVVALLNIGVAQHLAGQLAEAVATYQRSLHLCQQVGLTLEEVKLHSNLAEALAELNQNHDAQVHWQVGRQLSVENGFDEQVTYFAALAERFPVLHSLSPATPFALPSQPTELSIRIPAGSNRELPKTPEAQQVLALAQREPQITPKLLIETLHMSKATATRRLTELVDQGYLCQAGKGRGTYYTLAPVNGNGCNLPSTANSTLARSKNDMAALAQCLRQHRSALSSTYALTALGIIQDEAAAGASNHRLDLAARFATLPDLRSFFALETQLAKLLNLRVDLKLADTGQASRVTWLW